MNQKLISDMNEIISSSIEEVLPITSVKKALTHYQKPKGRTILIGIGKASYTMAKAVVDEIEIDEGLIITKYNYNKGSLRNCEVIEAGHPILDENSILGANKAIKLVSNLNNEDLVLFLISGGGSSLFEVPCVPLEELKKINQQLLQCGANINEINTIRKRLSKVKGGQFAKLCEPAKVINIILSDIVGDPLDMIASGPTVEDQSNSKDAINIVNKYHLSLSNEALKLLKKEPIKELNNVETYITGNNDSLLNAAKIKARQLGYTSIYTYPDFVGDIEDGVKKIKEELNKYKNNHHTALFFGGELTLEVKGKGLGGRCQELACRLAKEMNQDNILIFAIGSDGTDGPTDAAGGYCDKNTYQDEINEYIKNSDTYHYLEKYNYLIKTGPTGTNVCDLYGIIIL